MTGGLSNSDTSRRAGNCAGMALPKARGRVLWTKRGLHLAPVNVSSLGVRPTVLRGPSTSVRRHNRTAFYSRPSKRLQHYERRHSANVLHPSVPSILRHCSVPSVLNRKGQNGCQLLAPKRADIFRVIGT